MSFHLRYEELIGI